MELTRLKRGQPKACQSVEGQRASSPPAAGLSPAARCTETSTLMAASSGSEPHDLETAPSPPSSPPTKRRVRTSFEWSLGIFFILVVAMIWTFASVLVQYIFHELSFQGPFFLTYVGISLFSINLPLWYLSQVVWPSVKRNWRHWRWPCASVSSASGEDKNCYCPLKEPTADGSSGTSGGARKTPFRKIIRISAIISPLWFMANFTYNISLNMTTVTSSTIISSTSTVFTFLLSVCALKEQFVWLKLVGVLLCVAGNISTIFKDSESFSTPPPVVNTTLGGSLDAAMLLEQEAKSAWSYVVGDMTALFSAFMYGVYTTAIRRLMPEDDDEVSVSLFFGFIGVINFVVLFPFVVLNHVTGIESLTMLTSQIIGLMLLRGIFDNVLSDYLWARAVLLTSPTVATVGLSLTVPFAILSDYIFHGMAPSLVTLMASTLVLSGFYFINVSTRQSAGDKTKDCETSS